MKLLLVNPPNVSQGGRSNPVLGLLYLAGYIKNIAEVKYYDGFLGNWVDFEAKLKEFKPDFVGVQMLTPGRHKSLKVLEIAKTYDAKTIAGGPHASIMAQQLAENYEYIDYIVIGEGEASLEKILIGNGDKFTQSPELNINTIPFPAWELANLDNDKYIGKADIRVPIIASRGCTGNCTFCSTHKVWKKYRVRTADNIVEEIDYIIDRFNKRHFVFEDDSLSCNLDITKEIMGRLASKGIRFFATMRADGMDIELANLLKKAGCYEVSIGFESGSQQVLDAYNKHIKVEQNIKAALAVKEVGINLCALMIYNGMLNNEQTREETRQFLEIIQPDNVGSLKQLWVLPGTKIYNDMKAKDFIDDNFWLGPEPYYIYQGELGV